MYPNREPYIIGADGKRRKPKRGEVLEDGARYFLDSNAAVEDAPAFASTVTDAVGGTALLSQPGLRLGNMVVEEKVAIEMAHRIKDEQLSNAWRKGTVHET